VVWPDGEEDKGKSLGWYWVGAEAPFISSRTGRGSRQGGAAVKSGRTRQGEEEREEHRHSVAVAMADSATQDEAACRREKCLLTSAGAWHARLREEPPQSQQ
jgi:hypothetical protein